jgi:hypothetical protein
VAEIDPAKIAYYIYTVEPNACPDCEARVAQTLNFNVCDGAQRQPM